jgi:hypothetical protein
VLEFKLNDKFIYSYHLKLLGQVMILTLQFELNILLVGPYLLKESLSPHMMGSIRI